MAVRTITCIPGVTGDWRYPGGGVSYDTRGFFGLNWAALWRDDLRTSADARTEHDAPRRRAARGRHPTGPGPVRVREQSRGERPHQTKVLRGLARDDLFTVVVEHFLTDTTRYADIVLPATMQIEHRDLLIAYGHLYVAWNEPAAPPPGECLEATEIFRRLARTMGLDEPALYDDDETIARQVLDSRHPSMAGITLEALKARGWMRLNYPDPFVPFATAFPTPSGKLEFVSERMAESGLDPVAGYTPAHETSQPDTALAREYPLALVTPADHYFLNSIFANVPRQQRRSGAPDAPDPSRRCRAQAHRGGRRSARRQRAGLVLRCGRGERPRSHRRRREHERPLAARLERGRDRQRHRRRARFGHGRRRGVSRQPGARRQDLLNLWSISYAVVVYSVSQRARELGIRVALGASRTNMVRLVTGHGIRFILIGLATGIAMAASVTRLLSTMLFGLAATDAVTFGQVAVVVGAVWSSPAWCRRRAQGDWWSAFSRRNRTQQLVQPGETVRRAGFHVREVFVANLLTRVADGHLQCRAASIVPEDGRRDQRLPVVPAYASVCTMRLPGTTSR